MRALVIYSEFASKISPKFVSESSGIVNFELTDLLEPLDAKGRIRMYLPDDTDELHTLNERLEFLAIDLNDVSAEKQQQIALHYSSQAKSKRHTKPKGSKTLDYFLTKHIKDQQSLFLYYLGIACHVKNGLVTIPLMHILHSELEEREEIFRILVNLINWAIKLSYENTFSNVDIKGD